MSLESWNDVVLSIGRSRGRTFHLLLGNGFSSAYDRDIFSYNALHDFVQKLDNPLLGRLFDIIKTQNFELVLQQLGTFGALLDAFGSDAKLRSQIKEAASLLRTRLLDAIQQLHPEHVFTVPQHAIDACGKFLGTFLQTKGCLFTTNYDLLLYWVLMRSEIKPGDGFGRDLLNEEEVMRGSAAAMSELRWGRTTDQQRVFYIHGALPLFDAGSEVIKEEYNGADYLIDRVRQRIANSEYPVFVAAGDGNQKLAHIKHNAYLSDAYEHLASASGSVVTFGFGFGESDGHIIDALNRATRMRKDGSAPLVSVYIGVYSDRSYRHASEVIAPKLKCKKVHIWDTNTVDLWGKSAQG